jgi:hypothetical protein
MYSTCLHCHGALGRNEDIESFPVGRRLAFDAAKGRLWVICPACKRWNLSALEERWEAVEWCEREYRATTTRVATSEIGLARLKSGMEIVRIGKPMRPEFAAWRYGRQLHARRRATWLARTTDKLIVEENVLGKAAGIYWLIGGPAVLLVAIPARLLAKGYGIWRSHAPIPGIRADGKLLSLNRTDLDGVRFSEDDGARWKLEIQHFHGTATVRGPEAVSTLGRLLTHVNDAGGTEKQVATAVAKIEYFRGSDGLLDFMARTSGRKQEPLHLALGYEQRLAIEMVAHEESERGAMEGELASLEAAWREAEEVSEIADNLLTPASIMRRIRGARQ